MKNYEHSETFSRLKDITEKINTNLTSLEYLQTLDMFLWNALAPVHSECPLLFHNYVAKIVAQQSLKASTKFTSLMADERHKLPLYLFNMLTTPEPQKAHEHARSMFLNRGLLFGFLSMFLKKVAPYEQLHTVPPTTAEEWENRQNLIIAFEKSLGVRHGGALYGAIQQCKFWHDRARRWKEMIIEKYARLALNHAKIVYQDFNHYVRLGDVVQIHMMVVSRAIDRCDPRQGVLTTFITNWFKSARSEVAELAKTQFDHSYEQLAEELGDSLSEIMGTSNNAEDSKETVEHIAYLAKQIDRFGYVRASLGIPEFLTKEEKEILYQHVVNP
jgi:hypothetical protein